MSYIQKRGKNRAWRQSLMKNLLTELIKYEKLEITVPRAKELKRQFDKLITIAKRDNLSSRRKVKSKVHDSIIKDNITVVKKVCDQLAKKYKDRNGGYTTIAKLDNRIGDNTPMAIIALI